MWSAPQAHYVHTRNLRTRPGGKDCFIEHMPPALFSSLHLRTLVLGWRWAAGTLGLARAVGEQVHDVGLAVLRAGRQEVQRRRGGRERTSVISNHFSMQVQ